MKEQFINALLALAKPEDDQSNEYCFHVHNERVKDAFLTVLNFLDIKYDVGADFLKDDFFISFENYKNK